MHARTHAHRHILRLCELGPGLLGEPFPEPIWILLKQWHQLGHMQICTSPQTDNHASTPPQFLTGQMPFLLPNQQRQSIEGISETLFQQISWHS